VHALPPSAHALPPPVKAQPPTAHALPPPAHALPPPPLAQPPLPPKLPPKLATSSCCLLVFQPVNLLDFFVKRDKLLDNFCTILHQEL
jgi:hypothetical protein